MLVTIQNNNQNNNMDDRSFRRFLDLPVELQLMVWESATSTQPRALLAVHRTGDALGGLGLTAYIQGNLDIEPELPFGLNPANKEAWDVEQTRYHKLDLVGDIVQAYLPELVSVRRQVIVNFQRDMVYMTLKPTHFAPLGIDTFRPLQGLARVKWYVLSPW